MAASMQLALILCAMSTPFGFEAACGQADCELSLVQQRAALRPIAEFPKFNWTGASLDPRYTLARDGYMLFTNVSEDPDIVMNVTLQPGTTYNSTNPEANGMTNGVVHLTVACGTFLALVFSFIAVSTGRLQLLHPTFTFMDLDTGVNGRCAEQLVHNRPRPIVTALYTSNSSIQYSSEISPETLRFNATTPGVSSDNPTSAELSSSQEQQTVVLAKWGSAVNRLNFTFNTLPLGDEPAKVGFESRRFLFTGLLPNVNNFKVSKLYY